MNTLIFDIHRATTSDGEGLRTTVFLKGCPLKCRWCHNPESISFKNRLEWDSKKCIGCKSCENKCIYFNEKGLHIEHKDIEVDAFDEDICPTGALKKIARHYEINEISKKLLKDKSFYEEFNGGITISGGEAMANFDYTLALLKEMKDNGIHTALDTCGYASSSNYMEVLPYTDLILYDLKLFDDEAHKYYTGVSNKIILENIKMLAGSIKNDQKIWIRTPLIPGATATIDNISKIGEFISQNILEKIERWELCAFNNLCSQKYEKLDMEWEYKDEELMQGEYATKLKDEAVKYVGDKVILSGFTS